MIKLPRDIAIEEYLNQMKLIQNAFLRLLNTEKDQEDEYQKLILLLNSYEICDDCHKLRSFLHLISKIYNNYKHQSHFYEFFEKIILYYKEKIQQYYSNGDIFTIFKGNKKILLFLLKSNILTIDNFVLSEMDRKGYSFYFLPEIKNFFEQNDERYKNFLYDSHKQDIQKEIPENFEENREKGENHSYLCELIRNDSVDEFIAYVNQKSISLSSKISDSIYETHSFLVKNKNIQLIEYAAFFGSIQIFQYLLSNDVELIPSLWHYAIHSGNAELIHILEEKKLKPPKKSYKKCFNESIKCHHNDIANYIFSNHLNANNSDYYALKYYNFSFLANDFLKKCSFNDFCHFDYSFIVNCDMKKNIFVLILS